MVAVLDPNALTGFHEGYFAVGDDDVVYLDAAVGAIPLSDTDSATVTLTRIGADWFRYDNSTAYILPPTSPATVGDTLFEGSVAGTYHGNSSTMFIGLGIGFARSIYGIQTFDMLSGALDPRITFTRASSGTYFDSNGVMQTAATDTPRFNYEYNGSSWVAKGLRIEFAATNLLLRSREFDNDSWTKVDATITANAFNGVGGDATMDLCTEGSAGTARINQAGTITSNSTNTFAIDLKRGNHDWIILSIADAAAPSSNYIYGWFNLATGAKGSVTSGGTASGATTDIQDLGNGIYRCILTGAINNSATSARVGISSASANGSATRVSGATRYQDRAQLEAGAIATSFIETTTATATRAADVALVSGTNFSSWFNQSAGSVVTYANSPGVGTRTIWQIDDGTANNRYTLYTTGTSLKFDVVTGGVTQASLTLGTITANTTFKAAVAFATNDIAGALNGGTVQTDASATLPTVDRKRLGADATGNQLTGHIERDVHFPTRLENANLQSLSA